MNKRRIRQVTVSTILIVALSILLKTDIIHAETSKAGYCFVLSYYILLWIIPAVCRAANIKAHCCESIAAAAFRAFQIVFWFKAVLFLIPDTDQRLQSAVNVTISLLYIAALIYIIRFETKPKAGFPTKSEVHNLQQSVSQLALAAAICADDECFDINDITQQLIRMSRGETEILHGIDISILKECEAICTSALSRQENEMKMHQEMLRQLIRLAIQKEVG